MDPIKEAFTRAKQDVSRLEDEVRILREEVEQLKRTLTIPTQQNNTPTFQHRTPTDSNIPTHDWSLEGVKSPITDVSTGNDGVPTNQPTNKPTNQHILPTREIDEISHLQRVSEILGSLDELKKEVRIKFKKLTNQEMTIYSHIYQLEEEGKDVDYSLLSSRSHLSEISIRDYVRKIMNKGIPLEKKKIDNKKILLSIPDTLKRVATLPTIMQLREL